MSSVSFTQCDSPLCTARLPRSSGVSMAKVRAHIEELEDAGWTFGWDAGQRTDFCPEHEET